MGLRRTSLLLSIAFALTAAQIADMSGTWQLNVSRSSWGHHPKLAGATVSIEHHEPSFKYSGSVTFPNGVNSEDRGDTGHFAFDGAIDGKEYPVTGTLGPGQMSIHRISTNTVVSDFKSNDGKVTETARMTISADGKTLTRVMRTKGPTGNDSWTEIYDRH